jgi:hypothetical protein
MQRTRISDVMISDWCSYSSLSHWSSLPVWSSCLEEHPSARPASYRMFSASRGDAARQHRSLLATVQRELDALQLVQDALNSPLSVEHVRLEVLSAQQQRMIEDREFRAAARIGRQAAVLGEAIRTREASDDYLARVAEQRAALEAKLERLEGRQDILGRGGQ